MDAFQRRTGHQGILPWHIEQRSRFHHQEWSQALAAAEPHVAHGIEQSRRPGTLALDRRRCQQVVEQRLSVLGDLTEPVLKDRLDVDALFRSIDAGHAFERVPTRGLTRFRALSVSPQPESARPDNLARAPRPSKLFLAQFIEYVE